MFAEGEMSACASAWAAAICCCVALPEQCRQKSETRLLVWLQNLGVHAAQRRLQAADGEAAAGVGCLCGCQALRLAHQLVVAAHHLRLQRVL